MLHVNSTVSLVYETKLAAFSQTIGYIDMELIWIRFNIYVY